MTTLHLTTETVTYTLTLSTPLPIEDLVMLLVSAGFDITLEKTDTVDDCPCPEHYENQHTTDLL